VYKRQLAGPVNLNECIDNSIKLMHNKFIKAAVKLEKDLSNEVIVAGDTAKIEQLFINILTNCVDFCETDCKIRIAQTHSRDEIRFYAIKIEDNGPGIRPDIINKIFDPFFTTKEVGRGTGMGLAICHRIMEDLNGNIDIRSDGVHGTTVVLEFVKYADF
jgi:signal transduction histidine kinase